jgi:hypothetical protein
MTKTIIFPNSHILPICWTCAILDVCHQHDAHLLPEVARRGNCKENYPPQIIGTVWEKVYDGSVKLEDVEK